MAAAPQAECAASRRQLRLLRVLGLPIPVPDPAHDGHRLHRWPRSCRTPAFARPQDPAGIPALRGCDPADGQRALRRSAVRRPGARDAGQGPRRAATEHFPVLDPDCARPCVFGGYMFVLPGSTRCRRPPGARPSSSSAWSRTSRSWASSSTSTSSSTSFADLLEAFGFQASRPVLGIVLPAGISFYTFQAMSYTIDIYRGKTSPRGTSGTSRSSSASSRTSSPARSCARIRCSRRWFAPRSRSADGVPRGAGAGADRPVQEAGAGRQHGAHRQLRCSCGWPTGTRPGCRAPRS